MPLYDAFESYRRQLNGDCTNSVVLSKVIGELKNQWEKKKGLKEFMNILNYNPPPLSDEIMRIGFRFINNDQFNYVKMLLKDPYAHDLSDFIRRSLTWYLRSKKSL